MEYTQTLKIVNSQKEDMLLVVEPWGEPYEIPPGGIADVVACGPEGDSLEIAIDGRAVTLWGWPGSRVNVVDKTDVAGERSLPKPRVPHDTNSAGL